LRYYFDVLSPRGLAEDPDGEDFASEAHALKEAVYSARELASERILLGESLDGWAIVMRDERGETVQKVELSEIVHGSQHWFPPGSNPQSDGSPQH
jgi:hypothetical protein